MKIDLSGKIAVVTGASGQLGRVMGLTLAECGADVALHYHRSREEAEKVKGKIEAMGRRACLVQGDVSQGESVQGMKRVIESALGEVDIVVTNAIAGFKAKPVLEQEVEAYLTSFGSTAIQNVLMAQAFVPGMIRRRWGRIIAISTEVVMLNHAGNSAYSAGKRGMDGVLRVLAREIGEHQITVNQVAPGWTISARDREAGTEVDEGYSKHVPLRRRGEDVDIANAVAFLASDLARFITGAFLPVCGGNVMVGI